ncbi:MAG: RNA-binding cell elongation regulator Jag/EloR [Gaiella sp.]
MSDDFSAEGTGETVGEAKWAALRALEERLPGLDRDAVELQVLSEGERGLLGVGFAPARVLARVPASAVPAPAPAPEPSGDSPEAPDSAVAAELCRRVATAVGVSSRVGLYEDEDGVVVTFDAPDLGPLIGRHGQTLDAIQYLANALAHHAAGEAKRQITIDAGGYRERRTATIEGQARRAAEQAAATGRRVALEPMSAVERRIAHEFLKDDPEVETASEGDEPYRAVVVVPRRADV